jgi:hypothetical protein
VRRWGVVGGWLVMWMRAICARAHLVPGSEVTTQDGPHAYNLTSHASGG